MIVVDTNVIVFLLIQGDQTALAEKVLRKDSHWLAPKLWRSEFSNALVLGLRGSSLRLEQALEIAGKAEFLMRGRDFQIRAAPVLKLAEHSGCIAYDCEFVCLAQELGVPLVTADEEILTKFGSIALSMENFCS
ncbi:MAG: VapC toxin family PIN domain ribonuclease [Acidobacteria bacterium]|nr:MAG: VapC toxin family PIN domain ribonuclease [Acidobacteriota bacterium]